MSKLGSQVAEFGSTMERIKRRQELLKENAIKLEAMKAIKDIQSQLTTINFLDVLAVMDPDNPLKKEVIAFEETLSTLRGSLEMFVSSNQFDSAVPEVEPEEDEVDIVPDEPEKEPEEEDDKIAASGENKKVDQEDNEGDGDEKTGKNKDAKKVEEPEDKKEEDEKDPKKDKKKSKK